MFRTDDVRVKYLRVATVVAFIAGIVLSHRLWFGWNRTFPRAPLLISIPSLEFVLAAVLLILLGTLAIKPSKLITILLLIVILCLAATDQNRLQPWVYQYILMLALLGWAGTGTSSAGNILSACQLLLSAQYFWSGLQKLNWSFTHETFGGMLASVGFQPSESMVGALPFVAVVIALVELLIGFGLLIRPTRRLATILAIVMHLLLLIVLLVSRQNSVIWPWNVAMIAIVIILFWKSEQSPVQNFRLWKNYALKVVLVLVCLLPTLNLFGWFDSYLSFALYSGNTAIGAIKIDQRHIQSLPNSAHELLFQTQHGDIIIPIYEWAMADLNVPAYPEPRVFRLVGRSVCGPAADRTGIELITRSRPNILDGKVVVTRTNCDDLGVR